MTIGDLEFEEREARRETIRQARRDEYQGRHPQTRRSTRLRTDLTPNLDPEDWYADFHCTPPCLGWDDPQAFATLIHILVCHNRDVPDEEEGFRVEHVGAGKAVLFHMNLWHLAGGVGLRFAFDSVDGHIYNHLIHIYDEDGFVRPELIGHRY